MTFSIRCPEYSYYDKITLDNEGEIIHTQGTQKSEIKKPHRAKPITPNHIVNYDLHGVTHLDLNGKSQCTTVTLERLLYKHD